MSAQQWQQPKSRQHQSKTKVKYELSPWWTSIVTNRHRISTFLFLFVVIVLLTKDIQKAHQIVQSFIIPPYSIPSFTGITNQDNNTTQNYDTEMMDTTETVNQILPQHNATPQNVSLQLHELLVLDSPLHDKTLPWNPNIHRYWWSTRSKLTQQQHQSTQPPPAMLLLTTMGWNSPNQTYASQVYRGIRVRELMDGVINHPWFHPTAWEDIQMGRRNISNTTRYYIFLDYDTCREMNYPNYGRGTLANADLFGREYHPPFKSSSSKSKPPPPWGEDTPLLPTWLQQHVLQSALWKHSASSSSSIIPQQSTVHLVLWDCVGLGPLPMFRQLRNTYGSHRIHLASLSANYNQLIQPPIFSSDQQRQNPPPPPWYDDRPWNTLGLPPPAVNPCNSTEQGIYLPQSFCQSRNHDAQSMKMNHIATNNYTAQIASPREHLVTFSGMVRSHVRYQLWQLSLKRKEIIVFKGKKREVCQYYNTSNLQEAYHRLSRSSLFGACPRGDNAFSYRFTEQLSCGTIPVVYSDGWVLPFSYDFIDWEDVAVIIPEAQVDRSLEILQSIPAERLCDMQRKGLELYNRYLRDGIGVVAGIIETLELQQSTLTKSYSIFPSNKDDKQLTNYCSTPTATSPLRDKSLCWDDTVDRIWMRHNITHPINAIPPGMLLVTNLGWFHPINHIHYHRSWLSTELLEGVINHPWFNPISFDKFVNREMIVYPNVTYYIFLDVETCDESLVDSRKRKKRRQMPTYRELLQGVLSQINVTATWKIVYWDCSVLGPQRRNSKSLFLEERTIVASLAANKDQILDDDMGLAIPPPRKTFLQTSTEKYVTEQTLTNKNDITNCRDNIRPILLFFSGHFQSRPRRMLRKLHNGKDIWIGTPQEIQTFTPTHSIVTNFTTIRKVGPQYASFCAIPRNTIHFAGCTARFMEAIQVGCIPVLLADAWVLPSSLPPHLSWSDWTIRIPKSHVDKTVMILQNYTESDICTMHRNVRHIYQNYFSNGRQILDGLIRHHQHRQQNESIRL